MFTNINVYGVIIRQVVKANQSAVAETSGVASVRENFVRLKNSFNCEYNNMSRLLCFPHFENILLYCVKSTVMNDHYVVHLMLWYLCLWWLLMSKLL